MVNTSKLRGIIREKGLTIEDAAKIAGISTATMHRRLDRGIFGTDEIDKLVIGLSIDRPSDIFFVQQ